MDRHVQIEGEEFVHVGARGVEDALGRLHASVVHQNVDGPDFTLDAVDQPIHLSGVEQVRGDGAAADFLGHGFQWSGCASDHRDPGAGAGE